MRTLDLIKVLSEPELKTVEKSLTGDKRENLMRVFKELKKYIPKKQAPTHEELFKKVFKEPYAKDKDYLLRNRMKQLNEIIYEYLATDAFQKNIDTDKGALNYWLAKAYYDRSEYGLFEKDIDGFIKDAREKISRNGINNPPYSQPLHALKSLWINHHGPRLQKDVEEQLIYTEEWMQEEQRRMLYRVREIELREAFLTALLDKVEGGKNTPAKAAINAIDLHAIEQGDWYARYLSLNKQTHQTAGEDRIAILRSMLELYEEPAQMDILGHASQIAHLNNLATEYVSVGKYTEADAYFHKTITACKSGGIPIHAVILQGYILNQLYLEKYAEGLKIYKQYNEQISRSSFADVTALVVAYLNLFLGHDEKAINILHEGAKVMDHLRIHTRYVYLISYLIRGEYALAQNELFNLKRMIKNMADIDIPRLLSIAALFDAFIKSNMQATKAAKEKRLAELVHKVRSQSKKWHAAAVIELPLRWLLVKLGV